MKRFDINVTEVSCNWNGAAQTIPHFLFGKEWLYDYDPPDVINILTKAKKEVKYLEIGVDQGHTFDNIKNVSVKHGVDPYGASENITHRMSSQMFFSMNSRFWKQKYDIIFIDAIHLYEFVEHEIKESLKILEDDGFIVLHDTCPQNELRQLVIEEDFRNILNDVISSEEKSRMKWHENTAKNDPIGYNGDVWKNVAYYMRKKDFTVFSIPSACISIISPKKMKNFKPVTKFGLDFKEENIVDDLTWHDYYLNFESIMNPVSMEYFKENILEYVGEK